MTTLTIFSLRQLGACDTAVTWMRQHYPRGIVLDSLTPEMVADAIRAGLRPTWIAWARDHIRLPSAARAALGPSDAARAAAIEAGCGYLYARDIDRAPRDDTRAAAIRDGRGYEYARDVDECPRDDTRAAAIEAGRWYEYALDVDRCPRDDTRAAAIREGRGDEYDAEFPLIT